VGFHKAKERLFHRTSKEPKPNRGYFRPWHNSVSRQEPFSDSFSRTEHQEGPPLMIRSESSKIAKETMISSHFLSIIRSFAGVRETLRIFRFFISDYPSGQIREPEKKR
jgi:hypothetical protein